MGVAVRFAKGVVEQIVAAAAATPAVEVCGLLLGTTDQVDRALACANVAAMPATAFEIDPAALIAALRADRAGGTRVLGCYHSHPGGTPVPSPRDAAAAAADGWLWLIVGQGAAGLFRAVTDGPLHGRFVALTVVPAQAGTQFPPSRPGATAGVGPPLSRG